MKAIVQLEFDGRCREAFEFYARALGGEIKVMNALGETKDVPLPPGSRPAGAESIRFAQLAIGDTLIQGNDLPPGEYRPKQGFNVALHVRDKAEAHRVFGALADGGRVETPLSEVAWSSAFGMLKDRFGTPWLILSMDE
ncbi:VOC family protein [Luteimonas gilva]|uniref:VOC family protein n=1 Tax=Luteimonas gilva TaxID=2572684 RepID=A0A4U5JNV6_9GAMM|nr:VOC family protein [Luteimonas gilva]TKR29497.1 VOC family protein [Luteimonas gilva]